MEMVPYQVKMVSDITENLNVGSFVVKEMVFGHQVKNTKVNGRILRGMVLVLITLLLDPGTKGNGKIINKRVRVFTFFNLVKSMKVCGIKEKGTGSE